MTAVDVTQVPFSRFGSYLCLWIAPPTWKQEGLLLRTMHSGHREIFRMALLADDRPVPYTVSATPTLCRMHSAAGSVEICFEAADLLRIRGSGVGLRLSSVPQMQHVAMPAGEGAWYVNCATNNDQLLIVPLAGRLTVDAPHFVRTQDKRKSEERPQRPAVIAEFLPDDAGRFEAAIHESLTTPQRGQIAATFEKALAGAEDAWKSFLKLKPRLPQKYDAAGDLATYVNYTSGVGPSGFLKRPTILMSKTWMTHCWSWDHCFNAIAHSYRDPDLAWDQLMVHFDLQDADGALPDGVSAEDCGWSFCKPPIHGWALSKMMRANRRLLTEPRLREIYPKLARWTNWWLEHRDSDGDGLPEYHHGNDSGWDNATVFDLGFPVAGPDLAAYLVVQCDVLSDLAGRLNKPRDAARWTARADSLVERMMALLWAGEQFVARKAFTGEHNPRGDCLLNYLPAVAGKRLPKSVRDKLASALKPGGRFLTDFGPATESPHSPLYVPDGYWRGPIWGSSTVLIADGLARCGHLELARQIARRYCDMCLRSNTFAENYDAITGAPLRDKAYTWGSSAYLILAHEFLM